MENAEEVLIELNKFEKNPVAEIPQILEDYLVNIAKTGYTQFPWVRIKALFKVKLENVINEFSKISPIAAVPIMPNVEIFKFDQMKSRIFEQFESYTGIPFTVQRLCELLTQPKKNYKRIDKFMRGLERVMLVVSTIDPKPLPVEDRSGLSNGFSLDSGNLLSQEPTPATSGLGEGGDRLDGVAASKSDSALFNGGQSLATNAPTEEQDSGTRRMGDSLESPAKRMRLSIEEDGGPCDSADQLPLPVQEGSPPGNECIPAATAADPANPTPSSADLSADSTPQVDRSEETDMEIDAECTSSEARLELTSEARKSEEDKSTEEVGQPGREEREAAPEVTNDEPAAPEPALDSAAPVAEEVSADSAAAAASTPAETPSNPSIDSAATNSPMEETDGDSNMELECGAEEGISTSGERGPASQNTQVETNSEAEASTAEEKDLPEAENSNDAEAAETVPADQQSVGSSQPTSEVRSTESVGVADSSDEAEQLRPAQIETAEAEPVQEKADNSPDQSV